MTSETKTKKQLESADIELDIDIKDSSNDDIIIDNDSREFSYEILIPKDRIAVLIGKKGTIKDSIEKEADARIEVDSKEGEVVVYGKDPIRLFTVREIIKAIARGFNPDVALSLLKQDYMLEVLKIKDFAKTKNQEVRLKGRVIGERGRSRDNLERLTETNICVYGKTIAIIGTIENVTTARKAVSSILSGSTHASVYKWLEKNRRDRKLAQLMMNEDAGLYIKPDPADEE